MSEKTDPISIVLPVQAWETILQILAQRPYTEVFGLIAEIKRQGDEAVKVKNSPLVD
jgi:hypothetical protein